MTSENLPDDAPEREAPEWSETAEEVGMIWIGDAILEWLAEL